jgi:hypothetical protein
MTNALQTVLRWAKREVHAARAGQALYEFVFVTMMLMGLTFGLIDYGRAIYERQVLINLSREGANLASRGTDFTNTVASVLASAAPLDLSNKGRVIVTSIVNNNGAYTVLNQLASSGGINPTSRIGQPGGVASLPANHGAALPQPKQTLYALEVFYTYAPITPVGRLLRVTLPTQLYDVAYF